MGLHIRSPVLEGLKDDIGIKCIHIGVIIRFSLRIDTITSPGTSPGWSSKVKGKIKWPCIFQFDCLGFPPETKKRADVVLKESFGSVGLIQTSFEDCGF